MNANGPKVFYQLETLARCLRPPSADVLDTLDASLGGDDSDLHILPQELFAQLIRAQDHADHFLRMDKAFSLLLPSTLDQHPASMGPAAITSPASESQIFKTIELLSRLPSTPQRLFPLSIYVGHAPHRFNQSIRDGTWAAKYLLPDAAAKLYAPGSSDSGLSMALMGNMQDVAWENLYVTVYVDTNTLVFANMISLKGGTPDLRLAKVFKAYVELLSELIDNLETLKTIVQTATTNAGPFIATLPQELVGDNEATFQKVLILRIFLWTSWQRAIMLYFFYIVGVQVHNGFSPAWSELLAVRGSERLSDVRGEDVRPAGTDYMCNWAFELLRSSRSSLGLDFRQMNLRFEQSFSDRSGRCIPDSHQTCKGDGPESCHRFTGAETKAQSAHRVGCAGQCTQIKWDEHSYRNGVAPRAVLAMRDAGTLQYCTAGENTLAISHVWAHGQGGRPEDGVNVCLHQLYSDTAMKLGCTSYWIDSTCIPSQKPLREEAIGFINQIFASSKVTLVSDQDIQSINVSGQASIAQLEAVLSTLLVCDWNVRAWTMLEAIRGSRSIYLLCSGETPMSLVAILKQVYASGSVALVALLASGQHLIPRITPESLAGVEESAYLLCQRHASRPGDEVVIWSLLANGNGSKDPTKLWQSRRSVLTGFLLSSCPRIDHVIGFSWAPSIPYTRPEKRAVPLPESVSNSSDGSKTFMYFRARYPSYDGYGSLAARIVHSPDSSEKYGLLGKWHTIDVTPDLLASCRAMDPKTFEPIWPLANFRGLDDLASAPGSGIDDLWELNPHLQDDESLDDYEDSGDDDNDDADGNRPSEAAITYIYGRPDEVLANQRMERLLQEGRMVRLLSPLAADGQSRYQGGSGRGELFGHLVVICSSSDGGSTWRWEAVHQWPLIEDEQWVIEEIFIQ